MRRCLIWDCKAIAVAMFLIVYCPFLSSSIQSHFKKVYGDFSNVNQVKGIDFIYMINLDQRPEKFAISTDQLSAYGIFPFRFSAVNGWDLTPEILDDVGLRFLPGMTPLFGTCYPKEGGGQPSFEFMEEYGKTYFCHNLQRGAIGCALSHLSVLQDAWDRGYQTIWVMEDDIEVLQNPHILSDLINRLDILVGEENWDVLFTDQDYRTGKDEYALVFGVMKRPDMNCSYEERFSKRYTTSEEISPDFKKISARFGTHSMIIRRSGMEKLLSFAIQHKVFLGYDLDNYFTVNRYGLRYDVVTNALNAITDHLQPTYKMKDALK